MQLRRLETAQPAEIAGVQKSHRTVNSEWAATVNRSLGMESASASSGSQSSPSNVAGVKLSELLVAHLLREMIPTDSCAEGGLAFDSWRGMLADAIAQEVSPRVDLLSSVIRSDGG